MSISHARARVCRNRFTARRMVVRIRSRRAFDSATDRDSPRGSFGSLSVRRHSRRSGRRARSPSPDGAPAVPGFVGNTLSLRARVGRGPLATPVHSTDVCNSRFFFQGMLALRLGALRAVFSPRDAGTLGSRRAARFSERAGPSERCLLRSHRLRVPLTPRRFAGSPAERDCVRRRRPADRLATILGSYPRA